VLRLRFQVVPGLCILPALEQAVGSRPEHLSDLEALGHHWSLSADRVRGARYLVAAGDRARAVYANDDAIRHYERALQILAECPGCEGDARAAREQLADLLALTGRRAEALGQYEAVRKEIERAADRVAAARVQRKLGGLQWEAIETTRINPTGEFPEPLPIGEAAGAIAKIDGYTENQTDKADMQRQWPQLKGQFLIDHDGIVRWSNIECATEGLAGMGKFPSAEEILGAARTLPSH
jgi:tetratricopeptide (TPR) repeat protein